jgi:hypothetical protein
VVSAGAGARPGAYAKAIALWPFALSLFPFIFLSTLNSAGYRYGASDLAFYVPAALARINPSLFPRDWPLIASQAKLTTVDEVLAMLVRVTGASLPSLLALLYGVTLALLAGALWLLGSRLYRTPWASMALVSAMTLRHAISRSGTNTLEGYFHPRQLAFALGALAVAGLLHGRRAVPISLVLAAGLLHPTTALWFAIWIGVALAVEDREARLPLAIAAAAGIAAGVWLLTSGPLAGRLQIMDAEWLATLVTKDYLFPVEWPLDVWLINMAYAPIIFLIYRRRLAAGILVPGETGVVIGCLSLLLVFAAALPLNVARVALAVQLQTPRVFWMLDLLATIYAVWALAEGMAGTARRAKLTAAIITAASLTRGAYVMVVKFPERPVAQLGVANTDWGRAMAWARTTPAGSGWIADPMHAVKYGTSVRVAGERDVFVEGVKDAAIGMYERGVAIRTRDRLAELADFDRLTPARARSLGVRYHLDYLVTEQPLDLPLAFQSGAMRVYRVD